MKKKLLFISLTVIVLTCFQCEDDFSDMDMCTQWCVENSTGADLALSYRHADEFGGRVRNINIAPGEYAWLKGAVGLTYMSPPFKDLLEDIDSLFVFVVRDGGQHRDTLLWLQDEHHRIFDEKSWLYDDGFELDIWNFTITEEDLVLQYCESFQKMTIKTPGRLRSRLTGRCGWPN